VHARTTVIRRLWRRHAVRRVEVAFAGFTMAEYGTWVAVLVYAYERGGTTEASLVAIAQLLPAGLAAPFLAGLADRRGGARALRLGYWALAMTLAMTTALIFAQAPDLLVYAAAVLASTAVTMARPAQAALVPTLVDDEDELTAINALSGWVESSSLLSGTALAGAVMMFAGPDTVIACFAVLVTMSAVLVAPVAPRHRRLDGTPTGAEERFDPRAGLTTLREDHGLAALVTLLGAEYFVIGVLDVLLVVLAISALELGSSGAGYLNASFGAGGMLGSLAAVLLIGRARLSGPLVAAALGWGVLLAVLGAWPTVLGAFALLAGAGATRTVLDVSGRTMLLREAPESVRGRVFGMLEGVTMIGLAFGSALVPAMVAVGGSRFALVATASVLLAITFAVLAALRRIDHAEPAHATLADRRAQQRGDVVGDRVRVA
jgi:MFS family permease